ncbi:hypothetical protein [Streptodolium elevatio]|uniref:Secreted protein n=1 Tax=Streptodolium elevatio TaxID=3157996 RepID=A0ABV3DI77_9ACTN
MTRKSRVVRQVAVALGVAVAAVACSSDDKADSAAAPPAVGSIPQLATMEGQALPLETYMLQPDQSAKILGARERMVEQCMTRQGFDFSFDLGASSGGTSSADFTKSQSEMRYLIDARAAASYGYHSPPLSAAEQASPPEPTAAEAQALQGTDGNGGCFAEVDAKLTERGVIIQDPALVVDINKGGMQRSLEDPRMKDAFTLWSRCMQERGYAYATPLDASNDPRWEAAETASPEEVATAVADTECMVANNVAGIWFAVESAYQKREIEANFEKLEEVRKAIDTSMRVAEEITAQA